MSFLYNIGISLYHLAVFIASFFDPKAKKWITGRKNLLKKIEEEIKSESQCLSSESPILNPNSKILNPESFWFHCASLGEFEQGKPLMEKFKSNHPHAKIIVTFFSPSGYDLRRNSPLADHVFYLPPDSKKNAEKFISLIQPSAVFFVKYEFWHHHLSVLKKKDVPVFLVSGSFRPSQLFFKWYGGWFRQMLRNFTHIFVQQESSKKLLESISIRNVSVSGDTRFDRVFETYKKAEEIPFMELFRGNKKVFIAGSTWEDDEKIICTANYAHYGLKLIIAPHQTGEKNIQRVCSLFPSALRYSQLLLMDEHAQKRELSVKNTLVIDTIGILSRVYRYGDIAYVGGAFRGSLHNILEAAAFGLPVLFGPDYRKNWEAEALMERGGAFSVSNATAFRKKLEFLTGDEMVLKIASEMSRNFVRSNIGATEKIMEKVK